VTPAETPIPLQPPKRADARRNHDKLVEAAREAFAEEGSHASLEEIARRAGVGIGTLYRHFPTREALLEGVYLDEVQALSLAADGLDQLPPWEALVVWLRRFVGYAATKRALAEELVAYLGADSEVFASCRAAVYEAGEPLLQRAQEAGAVRPDADFGDVTRLVSGIASLRGTTPEQIDRIFELALDGLRYRAE
jgi:AcrR family transcriptional regulator